MCWAEFNKTPRSLIIHFPALLLVLGLLLGVAEQQYPSIYPVIDNFVSIKSTN